MIDAHEDFYKYKLSADPFRLSPDHRFAFSHPSYAKARAYLEFAIRQGEGIVTITGGPGTGKTTLINEIVAGIRDARVLMAILSATQLESRDLLHMVAAAFGLSYGDVSKAVLLLGLEEFLIQQQRKNKRAVLIVDEAQGLSPGAIEELRLLTNLQIQNRLLLQVVLVGQEQLREMVRAPGMEHLSQRIIAASHLDPLNLPDSVTYLEHRLKKVGWQGDPAITEDALRLIHKFSGGVPRRINLICSRLFLFGGVEGKHELTGEDAQAVIEDLQQESLLSSAAPECTSGEGPQHAGDTGGLPLSLPRDAPAADEEDAQDREDSSQERGEAVAEPVVQPQSNEMRASPHAETEQFDPGPKRRWDERAASGAGGPKRRPGSDATKPNKRRNVVVLLVVAVLVMAVGLVLAFSLVTRDPGDEGNGMAGADDLPSDAMQHDGGDMPAHVGPSTDMPESDQAVPEPESQQQDDALPQTGVLSTGAIDERTESAQTGDEALVGVATESDIANPPAAATELTVTQQRAPLNQPVAAPASQPEPVAEPGRPAVVVGSETERVTTPPVATRAVAPLASQPKTSPVPPRVSPAVPKIAAAQPTRPAAPAVKSKMAVNSPSFIKAALLEGQWTSQGKPASLLPSDVTLCKNEQTKIDCWSVPRNISTKFGEALYRVEATLLDFSAGGNFEILYRTLVKLIASPSGVNHGTEFDNEGWQVSEHATACQLTQPNRVSCRDAKGVVREYLR